MPTSLKIDISAGNVAQQWTALAHHVHRRIWFPTRLGEEESPCLFLMETCPLFCLTRGLVPLTQRMEGRTWTRLRSEEELQAAGVSKEVSQCLLRFVRVIPAQGHCDLAHLLLPWGKVVYSKEMCKWDVYSFPNRVCSALATPRDTSVVVKRPELPRVCKSTEGTESTWIDY